MKRNFNYKKCAIVNEKLIEPFFNFLKGAQESAGQMGPIGSADPMGQSVQWVQQGQSVKWILKESIEN